MLIVDDTPDNCPAMKRMKNKVAADFLPEGRILYEEKDGCQVHWLHLYITQSLGEKDVTGHVSGSHPTFSIQNSA